MPRQLYYFDIYFDAILSYFEQDVKYKYSSKVEYMEYISKKIGGSRSYVYRWQQYKKAINDRTELYDPSKDISPDFRDSICATYSLTNNIWDISNKDVEYIKYIKANMLDYYTPAHDLFNSFKNIQNSIFCVYMDVLDTDEISLLKKLDENIGSYPFSSISRSTKNEFLFEASKIYRSKKQYQNALILIEKLEQNKSDFYYRLVGEIKHEKAILYSAKGIEDYDKALEILQELVGFNYDSINPEIDILIASNYKRKALLNDEEDALKYINKSIYFYDKAKDLVFFLKDIVHNKIKQKKVQLQEQVDGTGNISPETINAKNISVYGDKCIAEIFKKIECFSKLDRDGFIEKIKNYIGTQDTELQIVTYFGREVYTRVKRYLNPLQNEDQLEERDNNLKEVYNAFAKEYTEKRNYILRIGTLNKEQIESILKNDPIWDDIKDPTIQEELKKYCVENFICNPYLDLYYLEKRYERLEIYYAPLNLCYMEKIKFYLYGEEESQFNDDEGLKNYITCIYENLKIDHKWRLDESNWWEYIADIEFQMLAGMPLGDIGGHIETNWGKINKDHLTTTLRQLKNVYIETIGTGQDINAEKLIKTLEDALKEK